MKLTKSQLKQLIKEHLNEYTEYDMSAKLTPEQQKVAELCDQLTDAVYEMERSSPDMTDTYLALFRALAAAGLNIEFMAKMV